MAFWAAGFSVCSFWAAIPFLVAALGIRGRGRTEGGAQGGKARRWAWRSAHRQGQRRFCSWPHWAAEAVQEEKCEEGNGRAGTRLLAAQGRREQEGGQGKGRRGGTATACRGGRRARSTAVVHAKMMRGSRNSRGRLGPATWAAGTRCRG
jgi:hypothetical protein